MEWKKSLIDESATIRDALESIDQSAVQAAVVISSDGKLQGVVTDGDVRRGLLRGLSLDAPVGEVMNLNPEKLSEGFSFDVAKALMREKNIRQFPVVDGAGKVVGVEFIDALSEVKYDNCVVLMAGGLGSRLRPLTNDCPKPLLKVGGKPILEVLLENFIKCGFKRFYLSVNYKAEMIRSHFKTGKHWGVDIQYLEETTSLGTAGSLSLLPKEINQPFFVVNGDILTNLSFDRILDFHNNSAHMPSATMCVRQYEHTVPYGVVTVDDSDHGVESIDEKPTSNFLVNAGIYVLDPKVLQGLSPKAYLDMPDLLLELANSKQHVATFPILEYWLDIGHKENLEQAGLDYDKAFA